MTKVQLQFRLSGALDEAMMQRIADAHGTYGIGRVRVDRSGEYITVDYDATRMNPKEVEAALRGAGIPILKSVN